MIAFGDPDPESDTHLRQRLFYVCGSDGRLGQEIATSHDEYLDQIAERYGLKRRMVLS